MITYDISKRGKRSKYEYLYRCIREDIRMGTLPGGYRLPSKRVLAEHLRVSVSTVEHAYDLLVSEGYMQARPGSGFFVCTNRDQGVLERSAETAADREPEHTLDINANRCSLKLFPVDIWVRIMRRTLSERNPVLFEAVPFNGLLVLREAIAGYLYESKGMRVSPDCIVVGAGTEYLYGRLLRLFGSRAMLAIGEICPKKLVRASQNYGAQWDYIPMDEEGFQIDYLEGSPASVVHVSPANQFPIGTVMSQQRRDELLGWAHAKPRRFIIEDDYDSELRYAERALPPLFTQDDSACVIYMNTFSKTLVPSLRISYMVLPEALMDLYREQVGFYSCSVSSFEQCALAEFIAGGYLERHINRLRRYHGHQRDVMLAALEASPLMEIGSIDSVDVGTHLLLRVSTTLSDREIGEAAAKRGMRLDTLADYSVRHTVETAHYVVVNFASVEEEQIPTVVDLLVDIFSDDIRRQRKKRL
jgi:GntR family transcriptional regulator / MocR family aminotransferase